MGDQLLLASQNAGKLEEMRQLMDGLSCEVVGPLDIGISDAPEESGVSFTENAELKARWYAKRSGSLTVADDSGLCVDALGGQPGVLSSRFAGDGASDEDRNRLLLEKLEGVPEKRRSARFSCAVAVVRGSRILFGAMESVEGRIAEATAGTGGFGYDPLFFFPPYGKTFGEISREDKAHVSHRGKAFARLRDFLERLRASGSD